MCSLKPTLSGAISWTFSFFWWWLLDCFSHNFLTHLPAMFTVSCSFAPTHSLNALKHFRCKLHKSVLIRVIMHESDYIAASDTRYCISTHPEITFQLFNFSSRFLFSDFLYRLSVKSEMIVSWTSSLFRRKFNLCRKGKHVVDIIVAHFDGKKSEEQRKHPTTIVSKLCCKCYLARHKYEIVSRHSVWKKHYVLHVIPLILHRSLQPIVPRLFSL